MDSAVSVGFRRNVHVHATLITKDASLTATVMDCSGMNQLSSSLTISIQFPPLGPPGQVTSGRVAVSRYPSLR